MDPSTINTGSSDAFGRRVHVCTMTPDQADDETIVRTWLRDNGWSILAQSSDPLERKLVAAQACDLCVLILGTSFGPCDFGSSFSHPELEVSAAADTGPDKVVIFARGDAEQTASPEQREFVARMRNFAQGTFQPPYHTGAELRLALESALAAWTPPPPRVVARPRAPKPGSIMISSTGDDEMRPLRAVVHSVLHDELGLPVIDYLYEPSESVTPLDRVLGWARQCRALVLILGERYGYISPLDGFGITELEFVTAFGANRPVLALVGPGAEVTKNPDQRQFLERVRRFVPASHVRAFSDVAILRQEVRAGLAGLMRDDKGESLPAVPEYDQLRWYHRQVQRWLGMLPHPALPQGMPLDQVYVSLNVTPDSPSAEASNSDQRPEPIGVDDALGRYPRLLLQGDPAAGKTVALRWYAVSAEPTTVPVYIRLSAFARALEDGSVTSLEAYLRREERRLLLGAENGEGLWMPLLQAGRGLILLDGLDEVPSHEPSGGNGTPRASLRRRVTREILALAKQLPMATPIVVATRTLEGGGTDLVPTFTPLSVQPLSSTQQRQLVLQWLHTSHPTEPLVAVRTTERVLDTLQAQQRLNSWASSPLMLTLLATILDASDASDSFVVLSKAVVLRRAVRLLLGQWSTLAIRQDDDSRTGRRLGGRHLWPKEQLLLHLAWNTFALGHREAVTVEDVHAAFHDLSLQAQAMCDETELLEELSSQDGALPQIGESQYGFYHPTFQEYLAAAWAASKLEPGDRENLVARKRLDAGWEEVTQLLVSELDRLGRLEAADEVVGILIDADRRPLAGLAWADPSHLALRRAARVQGSRTADARRDATGAALAGAWRDILQRRFDSREDYGIVWTWSPRLLNACQAFLDMGEAAATAAPLFRSIALDVVRQASSEDSFDRTPDPLIRLIEALGSSGAPENEDEDVALLARLLERDQGIGEPQAAALRGLLRLGPSAVRPYRDRLPRFVYAGSSSLRSMTGECGELAAALLIHLGPTREELEGIGRLGGRWRQEALWAAAPPLIPLADAIDVLHKAFNDGSGHIRGYYDERSRLDFTDDTLNDVRFAALASSSRLGPKLLPLLPDIFFRTTHDIPRNRRLAESIVLELGAAAVPGTKAYIADRCPNEELRELYFGHVLVGLDTASDPDQIRALLAKAIAALREIADIQDRQRHDWLHAEQAAGRTPKPQEAIKSVSLDQLLVSLRSAPANHDPLIRQAVINQALDSLAHMGPAAALALDDICLLARDRQFRRRAIAALAGLGTAVKPALSILQDALADPDLAVRAHAVEAIGQLGEAAIPALPVLRSLLAVGKNPESGREVRRQVLLACGRLWPLTRPFLPDILEAIRTDPDLEVRITGVDALGEVADAEPPVLSVLHALAQSGGPSAMWETDLQNHAFAALEQILARAEDADTLTGAPSPDGRDDNAYRGHRRGLLSRLGRSLLHFPRHAG